MMVMRMSLVCGIGGLMIVDCWMGYVGCAVVMDGWMMM